MSDCIVDRNGKKGGCRREDGRSIHDKLAVVVFVVSASSLRSIMASTDDVSRSIRAWPCLLKVACNNVAHACKLQDARIDFENSASS